MTSGKVLGYDKRKITREDFLNLLIAVSSFGEGLRRVPLTVPAEVCI